MSGRSKLGPPTVSERLYKLEGQIVAAHQSIQQFRSEAVADAEVQRYNFRATQAAHAGIIARLDALEQRADRAMAPPAVPVTIQNADGGTINVQVPR